MEYLIYIASFLVVLTVVVFVHEYGHYWVAKRNGVKIETFSVGFGAELFGRTDKHGTRWKFSAIPLGGYVKMLGDADAASATADKATAGEQDSFPSKTVWQRMAIVFAGPAANFVFAIVVFALLFALAGRPYAPAVVGSVQEGSPAEVAGLMPGDRILSVDGREVDSFTDLIAMVQPYPGEALTFAVERDGQVQDVDIVPELREVERFGTVQRTGLIGVQVDTLEVRRSSPTAAVGEAVAETYNMITGTFVALGQMVTGERGTEELGGPLRIAQMSGEMAKEGLVTVVWFTAVLSVNLGLINLFPIPMLDGGHLVLYSIEAARGRPLTERSQEIAFRVGLAMVLSLMVFATWNDLVQLRVFQFFIDLAS